VVGYQLLEDFAASIFTVSVGSVFPYLRPNAASTHILSVYNHLYHNIPKTYYKSRLLFIIV